MISIAEFKKAKEVLGLNKVLDSQKSYVQKLEREHGRWLLFTSKAQSRHRIFEDGYTTFFDQDGMEWEDSAWSHSNSKSAKRSQQFYHQKVAEQALEALKTARKALKAEIGNYIGSGYPVENLAEKKAEVERLQQEYFFAKQFFFKRYVEPGNKLAAQLRAGRALQKQEAGLRSAQMQDTLTMLDNIENDIELTDDAE